jgi:hypothetical protein
MAFTKQTVVDRQVQYPGRYLLTLVSGSTYDLTAVPGTITQGGTPVNAALLQPIEDNLVRAGRTARLYGYRNVGGSI